MCFTFVCMGAGFSPKDLTNPNVMDRRVYVADPSGIVSVEAKESANTALWNLRQHTGVEAVIVVVPNTGDYTEEEFATELFTEWGIGKRDKDNGVLILIVPGQRAARIATGYGVEGVIPDISARKMIQRSIVPYMKNNDIDGAVTAIASDISNVLSDPVAAEELKSSKRESWEESSESDITAEDIINFVVVIIFMVFLFSFGKYIYDSKRFGKQDRYRQALGWHKEKSTYISLAILSAGLGLIPFMLMQRKYKRARNRPMECPACKSLMHKLNEEEDNYYLNAAQDLEEKLDTVDYDVWLCDKCGTIEKYPFRTNQLKYEECPNCHTIAMSLIRDHTVVPATSKSTGIGEKIYECKYCNKRTTRRYQIPQRPDATAAAIAAGAILGSGSRGGGLGGGFGGGRTGGGGATGRW